MVRMDVLTDIILFYKAVWPLMTSVNESLFGVCSGISNTSILLNAKYYMGAASNIGYS